MFDTACRITETLMGVVVAVYLDPTKSFLKDGYEFLDLLEVEAMVAVGLYFIDMAARLWLELSHISLVQTCKDDVQPLCLS